MGSVGRTYQKVYQAWLVMRSAGCFSKYSHSSVSTVTSGSAAIRLPMRSLRLATSEMTTTSAAVTRYLVAIQAMAAVIRTRRLQCRTVA